MPRHMPSSNQKRTNILTILGVVILLLLIGALINSYFVHERMQARKQKDAADAATSAAALRTNTQTAKQKADLAAKQAAAALKATQAINNANALTQNFQAAVEETQDYSARLNDIMTRWFSEYSDTKNDTSANRGAHVGNLLAIYNELISYKVPKGLQDAKAQLLGEMSTALDRLNVDPVTHQNYVHFEHDDADPSTQIATSSSSDSNSEEGIAPKRKATAPAFKVGAMPDAPPGFNAAGDIGAGFF